MTTVRAEFAVCGQPQVAQGFGGYVHGVTEPNKELQSVGKYQEDGAYLTYFFVDPTKDMFGVFMTQIESGFELNIPTRFEVLVYQSIIE